MTDRTYLCPRLITPRESISPALLRVAGGRIATVGRPGRHDEAATELGGTVVPGLVDIQVNGYKGSPVLRSTPDDITAIGRLLAAEGVTAWCPTIVSSSEDDRLAALDSVAAAERVGARVLGVHLEGPWISRVRKGAHDEAVLEAPDREIVARSLRRHPGLVRIVTLAPELRGGLDAIAQIVDAGAVASIGHSDASFEEATAAIDAGARMATHLFNAMRGIHHREPGIAGAVLTDQRIVAGLICDGEHVDAAMILLAFRAKTAGRIAMVSDVVPGTYADTTSGMPRTPDGALAGALASLSEGLRVAVRAGVAFEDALQAATLTPSELLGAPTGRLEPGAPADFVVLDEALRPLETYVAGERVWGP
jgi:N-acetylglucosamine-6-phosphate deacetylase